MYIFLTKNGKFNAFNFHANSVIFCNGGNSNVPFDNRIQYNLIISGPNFVSSFAYQDYVFFFYRETAVEYMNCGKVRL